MVEPAMMAIGRASELPKADWRMAMKMILGRKGGRTDAIKRNGERERRREGSLSLRLYRNNDVAAPTLFVVRAERESHAAAANAQY